MNPNKKRWPYAVIPTLLGSDFGVLDHLWNQNDIITFMVEANKLLTLLPASILDV